MSSSSKESASWATRRAFFVFPDFKEMFAMMLRHSPSERWSPKPRTLSCSSWAVSRTSASAPVFIWISMTAYNTLISPLKSPAALCCDLTSSSAASASTVLPVATRMLTMACVTGKPPPSEVAFKLSLKASAARSAEAQSLVASRAKVITRKAAIIPSTSFSSWNKAADSSPAFTASPASPVAKWTPPTRMRASASLLLCVNFRKRAKLSSASFKACPGS
mmetsp:Transcript_48533/g.128631  ORF Transcript_48533/g.128631 Transcript_48533/m.128631 type:complete len:220 (+) Transcript_48533:1234-1893(+)